MTRNPIRWLAAIAIVFASLAASDDDSAAPEIALAEIAIEPA